MEESRDISNSKGFEISPRREAIYCYTLGTEISPVSSCYRGITRIQISFMEFEKKCKAYVILLLTLRCRGT